MLKYQHDFEVFQNLYGPLSKEILIKLHPDKTHVKEMRKELNKFESENEYLGN